MRTYKDYKNKEDTTFVKPGITLGEYEENRRKKKLNGNTVKTQTPKEVVLDALFTALKEIESTTGENETTRKLDKAIFHMELLTNKVTKV